VLSCLWVVLQWRERVGRLISVAEGWVSVFWGVGLRSCMVCVACVMSHASILRSGVCPSIWYLSISDKPRAVVAPGWNPMRSSLMEAFGSRRVSLR
jgi:hypothetical protein